jgi:putative redox protein
MARATARIGTEDYATRIVAGGHALTGDEPEDNGGRNAGPAPYDLLLASLSACTAITLRMYAARKGWDLTAADVALHFWRDGEKEIIDRVVTLTGDLDEAQATRLLDVCERTPVTKTLKNGLIINTTLG